MARFVKHALFNILLAFFVNSAMGEAQKFVGPRLFEMSEKSTDSPISSTTAVALKDADTPYLALSRDEKAKARKELLDFIETVNANIKLLAEEFDRNGVVVMRAVKTINVVEPPAAAGVNDRDNSARSAKLERKLSPTVNFVSSAKQSPFKRAMQDKCDKEEAISQSLDAVD